MEKCRWLNRSEKNKGEIAMKKLFKKALSITLALTLLISTVFALLTSASAEEKTYQYFSLDYETEDSVTGISTATNHLRR